MSETAVKKDSMLERAVLAARRYEFKEDFIREHRMYYDLLVSYGQWDSIALHMKSRKAFRPGLRVLFGI